MGVNKLIANAILTAVLLVLCVAALVVFNRQAAPQAKILPVEGAVAPDYNAILANVTEEALRKDLETLCEPQTRFSGTPGCKQATDYVAKNLRDLGYQVVEQPFTITVPLTRHAKILDDAGDELEGIGLYPLLPNWFRTPTTAPEGLRGTIYHSEKGLAREFKDVNLKGNFALLPQPVAWNTVAAMGAAAVLYYDDEEKQVGADWAHHMDASLDMPRFFVTGDVEKLKGKTVTISARVDFTERPVRNVIGMLEAPSSEEAVVVGTHLDSYTYAPDLAPGAEQACSPAVFLAVARQLAGETAALKRTVILLATSGHGQGLFGVREFVRALGTREERPKALSEALAAETEAREELALGRAALMVANDGEYWHAQGREAESAYWSSKPGDLRDYFTDLFVAVVDEDLMAAVEEVTRTRVDWVRDGLRVRDPDGSDAQTFVAYDDARKQQQLVQTILSTPLGQLKEQRRDYLADHQVRQKVAAGAEARIGVLTRRHQEAASRAELAKTLARYKRVLFLGIDISSGSGRIALVSSQPGLAPLCMPADAEVATQLRNAADRLNTASPEAIYAKTKQGQPRVVNLLRGNDARDLGYVSASYGALLYFESSAALWAGHTGFTLTTMDDSRRWVGTPRDTLDKIIDPDPETIPEGNDPPLTNLCISARLTTAAISQWARGHGRIASVSRSSDLYTVRGQVVSQIGENLTPNHVMPGAIVRFGPLVHWGSPIAVPPGAGRDVCVTADWRGRFELSAIWATAISLGYRSPINIDAALLRPSDGAVTWTLSIPKSGPKGAYPVRNVKIAQYNKSLAMPVVFRSTPVQLVPMTDPATLRPYAGFDFIETKSMAAPQEFKIESAGGTYVCFVPPESRLYFTFKKGKKTNPNLMEIRAFALGATGAADRSKMDDESEIAGDGYLAADTGNIVNVEIDAALSMAQVNSRRTAVQSRYDMADEMVLGYGEKAIELAKGARDSSDEGNTVAAKHTASESLAYSSNIHPVIRKNASDAVVGILFYLFLAIPFAIFMEKLLIGHPDLRWQIAYQGIIFILFFFALRAVHPAYELVRSSYMILLGFITFALAAMVGVFVWGRFRTNIRELHHRLQERAEVADVSRAGAAMTAFLLGLSHMRKRPVRTGLTVGTLILTTFVMLCFTSVSSDLVDVEFPLGKGPYSGLLVRDRNLANIAAALSPLRELYGEHHVVAQRNWAGNFTFGRGQTPELAEYTIQHAVGDQGFEATANAMMGLSHLEPKVTPIRGVFRGPVKWFESENEHSCFLPRFMADQLRVSDEDVKAGEAKIRIGGEEYDVLGIFDGERLGAILDLDGEPLLPVDVMAIQAPGQHGGGGYSEEATDIPEDVPRLSGQSVVITPAEAMPTKTQTASIAVAFQGLDYREARELITSHLERSAEPAYYGLDGIAFYGGKFRMQSLEGLLELILPIIIAALTVLNTMRGSVYERKTELYVFNAVGLSPAHIRSLFLAEASVYAVVGAVGGYLLAQGVSTGLRAVGITAGLTMNYSSLSCVFVSVIIMLVVFVSSIFPARMAARLAAPAEIMTRERHTATGDAMEIDLPFTFNRRDRVAIIPYFVDWFENYGEGSAGEYFCSPPEPGIRAEEHGGAAPFVQTTTWLKPYDLGVSQTVEMVVRHTPDTGDNVATVIMTRKSGDRESWERCCHAFTGLLRKRFLTWRAVPNEHRQRLLERGRKLLEASIN